MSAGSKDTSVARKGRVLLASLCLMSSFAFAQEPNLDARLQEIREVARFIPHKALELLIKIEPQARAGSLHARADFLDQLCQAYRNTGDQVKAAAAADELLALGRASNDNTFVAKGLLGQAYVAVKHNDLPGSHRLAWEADKLAATTTDLPLRIRTSIAAGQSHAEDGNFPPALSKLQSGVALARQYAKPVQMIMSLNALALLYGQMKEYDKGFEALNEAVAIAEKANSPGRLSILKGTEYGLAVETNQPERALRALFAALAYQRQIGAEALVAGTLVDLSDSYLKQHDYRNTLLYANEALEAGRRIADESTIATAHINIGQAELGMGRLAEGKRNFEAGLLWYEKQNDKPEVQAVLMEYGDALERGGDMAGAVQAYHRERAISNELFEKRRQKATLELQEKYEAEKKQRQIVLLSRENTLKSTEIDNRRLQQRIWWLLAVVFAMAAVIVGILYRKVRHANAQLHVKNLELKQQSSRDPLTALYNRRHFQEFMRTHLQVEKRGAGTSGEEIVGALFLLDVDHFKHVNDSYGHAAGDAVLKMIADSLREILRETDMIVRWGGEEFLAFLPAIPRSGVEEIARRLLTGISSTTIDYQDMKISVNVSIGFAPFPLVPGTHALPWERAVNLVDMALYLAKAHGRNRAYGVRGFANFEKTSMEAIEQDLERAWRAGFVDLSIVHGGPAEPQADRTIEKRASA